MALIFAFRDETGKWHGSPSMDIDWAEPQQDRLEIPSVEVDEAARVCQFAGQSLEVLYASTEGPPGPVAYELSSGRWMYSTDEVYEELGYYEPTMPNTPTLPTPRKRLVESQPVTLELVEGGEVSQLEIAHGADDTLEMALKIFDNHHSAEIGRLQGTLPADSFARAGRLLLSAAASNIRRISSGQSTVRSVTAARRGEWTGEEEALLSALTRQGGSVETIAAEMGRTENAIRWKQHQIGLGPFPSDLVQPATPKPEPAYTMEELRRVHPNSHKKWTPADDERLAQRDREGATVDELMQEFGRNWNAITSRLIIVRQRDGSDLENGE